VKLGKYRRSFRGTGSRLRQPSIAGAFWRKLSQGWAYRQAR